VCVFLLPKEGNKREKQSGHCSHYCQHGNPFFLLYLFILRCLFLLFFLNYALFFCFQIFLSTALFPSSPSPPLPPVPFSLSFICVSSYAVRGRSTVFVCCRCYRCCLSYSWKKRKRESRCFVMPFCVCRWAVVLAVRDDKKHFVKRRRRPIRIFCWCCATCFWRVDVFQGKRIAPGRASWTG
jgi:hypothetical protein